MQDVSKGLAEVRPFTSWLDAFECGVLIELRFYSHTSLPPQHRQRATIVFLIHSQSLQIRVALAALLACTGGVEGDLRLPHRVCVAEM